MNLIMGLFATCNNNIVDSTTSENDAVASDAAAAEATNNK